MYTHVIIKLTLNPSNPFIDCVVKLTEKKVDFL